MVLSVGSPGKGKDSKLNFASCAIEYGNSKRGRAINVHRMSEAVRCASLIASWIRSNVLDTMVRHNIGEAVKPKQYRLDRFGLNLDCLHSK
jgi:hypothetical protein